MSCQDLLEGSYHMFRGPQTVRNKSISSGRIKGLTSASMLMLNSKVKPYGKM